MDCTVTDREFSCRQQQLKLVIKSQSSRAWLCAHLREVPPGDRSTGAGALCPPVHPCSRRASWSSEHGVHKDGHCPRAVLRSCTEHRQCQEGRAQPGRHTPSAAIPKGFSSNIDSFPVISKIILSNVAILTSHQITVLSAISQVSSWHLSPG